MTIIMSGVFSRDEAETLSDKASLSHVLNYPSCAIFENPQNSKEWLVDIYLECEVTPTILSEELGSDASAFQTSRLPQDVDWVKEGLKDLKPVSLGRFFVFGSHDKSQVRSHHHAIQIDANQAFGTGHHATTTGCLEAIEMVTRYRRFTSILDLGTGSGVLAAALAKQTRQTILATDIDPVATTIARENMALNELKPLVRCETATGFHHPVFTEKGPFDLIIANILAGPLRALAPSMRHQLSDNAVIILSGLLIHQQASVLSAYRHQGIHLFKALHKDGWATLILKRP